MSRVFLFRRLPIAADLCAGGYVSLKRPPRVVSSPTQFYHDFTKALTLEVYLLGSTVILYMHTGGSANNLCNRRDNREWFG